MPNSDLETLKKAIKQSWPGRPSTKAQRYVGSFFEPTRIATRIIAKVNGNHGIYTVSIEADSNEPNSYQANVKTVVSACSCYIGKGGFCHHCEALAHTFLQEPAIFQAVEVLSRAEVRSLSNVQQYLQGVTLDALLKELKESGVTQKAFAESIGVTSRSLSALKSSEARNRYANALGATKLACLWALEHLEEFTK